MKEQPTTNVSKKAQDSYRKMCKKKKIKYKFLTNNPEVYSNLSFNTSAYRSLV